MPLCSPAGFFFFYGESCCSPPAGGRSLLLLQDDVLSEGGRGFSLDGERTFSGVRDRLRIRRFAFAEKKYNTSQNVPSSCLFGRLQVLFFFFSFLFSLLSERRTLCEGKTHSKVFFKSVETSQALVFSHASASGRGGNQREQKRSL